MVYFSENEENRSKSVLWNNPIRYTDPDGRFPIDIHVRSFAPFAHFGNFLPFNGLGGLWHGDNRSFSTSLSASSRIRQVTNYETDTRESFTQAFGNISASSYGAFAYSEAGLKDYSRGNNINTHLSGNNDAFFPSLSPGTLPPDGGPTWAIDLKSNLDVNVTDGENGNQILSITGAISGDAFPNAEAFVNDADGNSVFLNVFQTEYGKNDGPLIGLAGDNNRKMFNVNTNIIVNDKGIFTGVQQGDNVIGIKEWNKQFTGSTNNQ